jgi:hypothetical protein
VFTLSLLVQCLHLYLLQMYFRSSNWDMLKLRSLQEEKLYVDMFDSDGLT